MTLKEEQSIEKLLKVVSDLISENAKSKKETLELIEKINSKTDKKHLPITLEQDILQVTQQSIQLSIKDVLTKYDSPLGKLVKSVIEENSTELKSLISDSFTKVIRTDDFKKSIVNAFSHKVSRTIISNNDGLFEKVSNELKQDSIFKAKMSLAVANVVEECLRERKEN